MDGVPGTDPGFVSAYHSIEARAYRITAASGMAGRPVSELLPGMLGTPIFTPYLEIPELEDYAFNVVYVDAKQENDFQFSDAEIAKLKDPKVKAFFVVNPGNPTSVALSPESLPPLAATEPARLT